MEVYGNIKNILKSLEKETSEKIDHLKEQVGRYREERLQKAERESVIHTRRIVKEAQDKKEDLKKRIFSSLTLEINRIHLKKQQKITDMIMDELKKKIDLFKNEKKYQDLVMDLLQEALQGIDEKQIKIILDKKDREKLDIKKISGLLKEKGFDISDRDIEFEDHGQGGVMVKCKNKGLMYNNTLKSRFNRMKEEFLILVHETLFKK
ncbi:MAG: hypothetical protein JW827_05145 [Spirochaetes bacterium]|nr:hypothetical protein [Spirochaetota bacterium]